MGYQFNVELDDFETYELCEEVIKRFRAYRKRKVTDVQKRDLKDALIILSDAFGMGTAHLPNETLEDALKIEFLANNWNKFTSWQLEGKLL